jgi:hypothetical protein
MHSVAVPGIRTMLAGFKEQIRNPLAPDDAVFLLRVANVRKHDGGLIALDREGARLVLADSPLARYRSLGNLEMAAGAALDETRKLREPASLLVRLFVGLADEAIYGQPLSLVIGSSHVRLGM